MSSRIAVAVSALIGWSTIGAAQVPFYEVLYSFPAYSVTPKGPSALIQGTDGNFYGSTSTGGTGPIHGYGTIFRVTPNGDFRVLHAFQGNDGTSPLAPLLQGSDGNFYGTTPFASHSDGTLGGTVFKMTPDGSFAVLHSFEGAASHPFAGLIQASDGAFYGTSTDSSGPGSKGTVFKITSSGIFSVVHVFDDDEPERPPDSSYRRPFLRHHDQVERQRGQCDLGLGLQDVS